MRPAAWLLGIGFCTAWFVAPAQAEMIGEPVAVLQGLDKITARVLDFDAP